MNEAETRAEHIDPALKVAGWGPVIGAETELLGKLIDRVADSGLTVGRALQRTPRGVHAHVHISPPLARPQQPRACRPMMQFCIGK